MRKCRRASNLRDEHFCREKRERKGGLPQHGQQRDTGRRPHGEHFPCTSRRHALDERSKAERGCRSTTNCHNTILMKQNCNQRTLFLLKESSFREVDVTGSVVCTTKNKTLFVSRGRFELNYSPKKKFEGPAKRSLIANPPPPHFFRRSLNS